MKSALKVLSSAIFAVFCVFPSFSQSFSRTYNPNLPIAYTAMIGMPQFPAKNLFVAGNFKRKSADSTTVDMVGSIESTNNTNGVFSGTILIKLGTQNAMRFTLNLQSDTDGDFNYITYTSVKNLLTGTVSETRWINGDVRTAGQLLGELIGIIDLVYDKNKLYGPEYAAAQQKREQEAAEKKAREEKEAAERKEREEKISSERRKANNIKDRLYELSRQIALDERDFAEFMQLCRDYLTIEYSDDNTISYAIRQMGSYIGGILNFLNRQQKVEYYTEFEQDKVEQAILDRDRVTNLEKSLNDLHLRCIQLQPDSYRPFNKNEFTDFNQIYKEYNNFKKECEEVISLRLFSLHKASLYSDRDLEESYKTKDHSLIKLYKTVSEDLSLLFRRLTATQQGELDEYHNNFF